MTRAVRLDDTRELRCKHTGKLIPPGSYKPMFVIGATYLTEGGESIRIVSESRTHGGHYDTVLGSDNIYRYDRRGDRGRVTGTKPGDPRNLKFCYSPEFDDEYWKLLEDWKKDNG